MRMPAALEFHEDAVGNFHHFDFFVLLLEDGNDDDLNGRKAGRQNETLIVTVHHDDGADDTAGEIAQEVVSAILQRIVFVEELDLKRLGEIRVRSNVMCQTATRAYPTSWLRWRW